MTDETLSDYRAELISRVQSKANVILKHEFLSTRNETLWEAQVFFREPQNVDTIKLLLNRFNWNPVTDPVSEVIIDGLAIVASIGTSSTQVYSQNKLIGTFQTGTTAMKADPKLAGKALKQIITVGRRKGIFAPIVLINSISHFVTDSVNLNNLESVLNVITEDPSEDRAVLTNILIELCNVVYFDLKVNAPCILRSKSGETTRLKDGWLDIKCAEFVKQYPRGVYLADFGGGGPDLKYFDGSKCLNVKTSRFLKDKQESFVKDMISKKYDNVLFQELVTFFADNIVDHATKNGILPQDDGNYVCHVYQTGMCRQQHYFRSIEAVTEISDFEDDDDVVAAIAVINARTLSDPRFDRKLEGYRDRLVKCLEPEIELRHEFLHVRDEALCEQQALFRSKKNIQTLKDLLVPFGVKATSERGPKSAKGVNCIKFTKSEKVNSVIDNDDEAEQPLLQMDEDDRTASDEDDYAAVVDHLAIVASIGTSSTQVYSRYTLIGNLQTGTLAMEADPKLAGVALQQIDKEARRKEVFAPIVLINSINWFFEKTVNLNDKEDPSSWREALGPFKGEDLKGKNEHEARSRMLVEMNSAVRKLNLSRPVLLLCKKDNKISNEWIEFKSKELSKHVDSASEEGFYIVDFGGGGPDIKFFDKASFSLEKVETKRIMLHRQQEFIADMIMRNYESELFKKIVKALKQGILVHAKTNTKKITRNKYGQILCRIFQTGLTRQQHYLGHFDPISEIMNFDDDDIGVQIDKVDGKDVQPVALNDNAHGVDRFGYTAYAKALVNMLQPCDPPVCVGIFAQWGTGKTFMFFLLKKTFDHTVRENSRTNELVQWFEQCYDSLAPSLDEDSPVLPDRDSRLGRWEYRATLVAGFLYCVINSFVPHSYAVLTLVELIVQLLTQAQEGLCKMGSGCSSFLAGRPSAAKPAKSANKIESVSDLESGKKSGYMKEYVFVDFNAWEYNKSDELWAGLINEMYKKVELRFANQTKSAIGLKVDFKSLWRVQRAVQLLVERYGGWSGVRIRMVGLLIFVGALPVAAWVIAKFQNVLPAALALLTVLGLPAIPIVRFVMKSGSFAGTSRGEDIFNQAESDSVKDKIGFMASVKKEINELFDFMLKFRGKTNIKLVIVIFVDDLDRCNDRALKVLEAIQLLLSVPGSPVIVFLGVDARIVAASIDTALNKDKGSDDFRVSGQEYLDKFVQIPFALPDPPIPKVKRFLASCADQGDATPDIVLARLKALYDWASQLCSKEPETKKTKETYVRFREEHADVVRHRPINFLTPSDIVERLNVFSDSGAGDIASMQAHIKKRGFQSGDPDIEDKSDAELVILSLVAKNLTESTRRKYMFSRHLTRDEALEFLCLSITFVLHGVEICQEPDQSPDCVEITKWEPPKIAPIAQRPPPTPRSPLLLLLPAFLPCSSKIHAADSRMVQSLQPEVEKAAIMQSLQKDVLKIKNRPKIKPNLMNVVSDFSSRIDPNPRKLKRIVNVLQLIFEVSKHKAVSEEKSNHMIYQVSGWNKFAAKLVKWISLCECYPFHMVMLIQIARDFDQKRMLDKITTKRKGCIGGDSTFQYRKRVQVGQDEKVLSIEDVLYDDMYVARFFYEYVEPYMYVLRSANKLKLMDGDPENFAILLHTPVQFDSKEVDITLGDLLGPQLLIGGRDADLSLMSYSFNLSHSLKHQIALELNEYLSDWEMYTVDASGTMESALRERMSRLKKELLLSVP